MGQAAAPDGVRGPWCPVRDMMHWSVASKGNVGQAVTYILGVIASVLVILERLLGSGAPLVEIVRKEWPVLVLAVAAGLATIFAAKLLIIVGRKVRPSFRTRSTKLRALETEIEALYDYKMDQLLDPKQIGDLSVNRFLQRCNELRAKLNRIGILSPEPLRGFSRWGDFLNNLHQCVIRGDVEAAKGVLERLEAADQKKTSCERHVIPHAQTAGALPTSTSTGGALDNR